MENGESIRAASSIRLSSSNIWRGDDIFSRSRDEEDDLEALKWAALKKLPTHSRLHVGILHTAEGAPEEVYIEKLGPEQRRELLGRLVRDAQEDHERFLLKLRDRIDTVGIDLPTIEVRYEHLTIEAEAYVGNRGLPTVFNSVINVLEGFANHLHILPSRKRPITILDDVSGIIKPRRLTLLLGPPGSGKTTLLLALAGELEAHLKLSGTITYNGHGMNEFVPQRTAAYISQHDLHLGEMTVRETLEFSARCQGVGTRYDMLVELARREKEAHIKPDPDVDVFMKATSMEHQRASIITDYILKLLGLEVCADTMVGDNMIRGISGGQKKRVTTGEMIVGPARALFMDEISTGLDSSTTFQIVNSFKHYIHILDGTAVISLLQPPPETFDLFDDIILLSDGLVVYQGPREQVLEFFETMGFKCPERKGIADFLQEVTSRKDQQQYWVRHDLPYRFVTVREFNEAFHSFHIGEKLGSELSVPFDRSKSHPAALATSKYGLSRLELLKVCISREWLLMRRNSFVYAFRAFQLLIMSFLTMTLFLRTNMHHDSVAEGGIYMGALFYSIIMPVFNGFSDLALTIVKLPVFYKQRNYLFFPAWAYALPSWILKTPISFIEAGVCVFIPYYVIGFDPYVGRLFKQYLLILFVNQMASGLFRFLGALGRHMVIANAFGSFALLLIIVLGGFILSHDNIKKWWIWGYWISPIMYSHTAITVNQFLGRSWKHILPNATEPLGVMVLKSRGVFTEAKWYWIGVGALIGYVIFFNFLFAIALTYLKPFGKAQPTISEDMLMERKQNNAKEPVQPSSAASFGSYSKSGRNETRIGGKITDEVDESNERKKGMEMKTKGIPGERLELLKGVSGSFRPGVLTALMGVSGAGKTTLMDVLAGRKTGGYIEGNIMVNGYQKKHETFARVSGYCEQNDIHSPHVTVHESLIYSAWLRLPAQTDSKTTKMFVEEVMELVELSQLRSALVGLPGVNGLSTEQRKRLTIAVELVANPSIIFMDEPTSGLDARAAAIVMRTVRNTVDTGRTVVCTIHQPSIDIFEAFDELFLMKRGGQEIYVGPLGHHSCHLINYFEGIGGVSKIKDGYNPATWMLEVTTIGQENVLGIDFSEVYKNSELFHLPLETKAFILRNPSYTAVRFMFTLIIALLFGTMFWDLGTKRKKQQDLFNAMGSMYAAVLFLGVSNSSTVQPVVAIEKTVFYRERAAGMYSALPYAFGQVAVEIPYIFVQAIIYGIIVYAMIGFEWTATKFFCRLDPKLLYRLHSVLSILCNMESLLRIYHSTTEYASLVEMDAGRSCGSSWATILSVTTLTGKSKVTQLVDCVVTKHANDIIGRVYGGGFTFLRIAKEFHCKWGVINLGFGCFFASLQQIGGPQHYLA
ncbi:hypothetical protein HPP92_024082 [Vanilla planifolia]|uniref:ABC transporter domain-containing protein n=1 Tax=Vanilla planifolia TaxID=51239 RepID=A0A835PJ14_VANPL|nr:hypothetical protein HPP92_024082 [Vanilla planifolia]